jgi:hypothetical protein
MSGESPSLVTSMRSSVEVPSAGWVIVDGTLLLAYGGLGGSLLTRFARSRSHVLGYANAVGLLFAAGMVVLIAPSA